MAAHLRVQPQMVARWDAGKSRVPPGVAQEVSELRGRADAMVSQLIADIAAGQRDVLYVPAGQEGGFQRAVVGRVLRQADVEVEYQA